MFFKSFLPQAFYVRNTYSVLVFGHWSREREQIGNLRLRILEELACHGDRKTCQDVLLNEIFLITGAVIITVIIDPHGIRGILQTPTQERTFKQLEDERLGWEAAERLHAQEQAELERQQEELFRQDELLACQLDHDFDIPAQQKKRHAMVQMVDRKQRQIAEQKAKAKRDRPMLKEEFEKYGLEATSAAMEDTGAQLPISSEDVRTSKESKVMEEKVESSEMTPRKRKSVARKGLHISKSTIPIETGDPDAEHKMYLKYASDEEDDSDLDTIVPFYAVVDWELLHTGLGTINVIYRKDNSLKYFTSLREILHLVNREDLMTIYGHVVTYYQDKEADGVGLILRGDLRVLIDSPKVDDGSEFWKSQHKWRIQSWKLYSFSGIHVLETVSGLVIYMFVDKKYPLTVKLMERMLDYQLEIGHGAVGNELTTAVQLVKFLKQQITRFQEWLVFHELASKLLNYIAWFSREDLSLKLKLKAVQIHSLGEIVRNIDDWIYEWNDETPWVNEKPWNDDEVWTELINNICHECNLLHFKNETAKWPTYNWKEDGYCNTGELPEFIREGNSIRYQDYEWYATLEDSELKKEALNNEAILEESINLEGESSNDAWSHDSPIDEWKDYEHTTYNNVCQIVMDRNETRDNKGWFDEHKLMKDVDDDINDLKDYLIQKDPPYYVNEEEETYKERRCKLLGIPYVKPTCKSEKFEVVIYSFRPEEEYVAIKEYEYDIWV
ncbi:hypothetical protein Tco_0489394 [Tanacetum coccineum]